MRLGGGAEVMLSKLRELVWGVEGPLTAPGASTAQLGSFMTSLGSFESKGCHFIFFFRILVKPAGSYKRCQFVTLVDRKWGFCLTDKEKHTIQN